MPSESFMMRIRQIANSDVFREILLFDTSRPDSKFTKDFSVAVAIFLITYITVYISLKVYLAASGSSQRKYNDITYNGFLKSMDSLEKKHITKDKFLLLGTLGSSIWPAINEELLFRFIVLKVVLVGKLKLNIHLAVFISALLFALVHYNNWFRTDATMAESHVQVLQTFMLGILFGYSYYYTNNIITPMMAHFFNNFSVTLNIYSAMPK